MKKKNILLLGLGAMTLLVSCGSKEITDPTKIDELKYAISLKKDETKNFEFTIYSKVTEKDKTAKEERVTNDTAHIRKNEDGETYVMATMDSGERTEVFYLVNDEKYEKLIYCDFYSLFNGEVTVIDYKGHEGEFNSVYDGYLRAPETFFSMLLDPYKATAFNEFFHTNSSQEFKTEIKFFSDKEGQLTIKIDEECTKEGDDTENHFEINYENFAFKGGSFIHTYSDDNRVRTEEQTYSLEKKDKLSINLPNGWENHLIKDND